MGYRFDIGLFNVMDSHVMVLVLIMLPSSMAL